MKNFLTGSAACCEWKPLDPELKKIVVPILLGEVYETHGEFRIGDIAGGLRIPGLQVDVAELMKLGDTPTA